MTDQSRPSNFIRQIIERDLQEDKHGGRVATRFPPEPNGFLHIGHAKSICLNFGVAEDYRGSCNLRFDDTNPEKETEEYARSIMEDVRWLGFEWAELRHASDYFGQLYEFARELITRGLAYVDSLPAEEIRELRGTLTEAGKDSPFRNRSVEDNLDLFARMRAGEFEDGAHVLRAKIDMASPNINMRDPVLYRIRRAHHHRTGDDWCIYPMYDFTHCISDALEGITHSLCTLEFEDHRPLYDWVLDNISVDCHPQQIEFSRLELLYTVTSKRKLNQLVTDGHVSGWDDPRMPTLSGMRRRGYSPESIRDFCDRIGVSKAENKVQLGILENSVREDLGPRCPRVMGVLRPIKLVLTNYPEGREESLECPNHPQRPEMGTRTLPFSREIYIDAEDFMEDPPAKYFRLKPGGAVRLKYAYVVDFQELVKDDNGEIVEIRCTYDPETRSGEDTSGRKIKGTIHWVSARHAIGAPVRLYDRLFVTAQPAAAEDFTEFLNPESMEQVEAVVEPSLADAEPGTRIQFERVGYFCIDAVDSTRGKPVFNRIVTLRDSWAKIEQQETQGD